MPEIILWIGNELHLRSLEIELGGENIFVKPNRGYLQGRSLSPLLWTLVIDEILYELNVGPVRVDGFADDLFALIIGFDFSTMSNIAQRINVINVMLLKVGAERSTYQLIQIK